MLVEGNGSPATAVRAVTSTPPSPSSSDLDATPRRSSRAADKALPPEKYARGKPRSRGSKGKGKGKGGGAQPTQTHTHLQPEVEVRGKAADGVNRWVKGQRSRVGEKGASMHGIIIRRSIQRRTPRWEFQLLCPQPPGHTLRGSVLHASVRAVSSSTVSEIVRLMLK